MRNGTGDKWLRGVVQQRLGPVSYAVLYGDQVRHVYSDHLLLVSCDSWFSSLLLFHRLFVLNLLLMYLAL